ncbi:MAG: AAA-like domain-containing protein [Clostridium sp.]
MKYFNTAGLCVNDLHYMVNIDNKIKDIEKLIDRGSYFTINKPRQYGKTTILNSIEQKLSSKYLVISLSFEGVGDIIFQDEREFTQKFINLMCKSLRFSSKGYVDVLRGLDRGIYNISELSDLITNFIEEIDKDVILLIDEVDKSSNNQLFLSFLGMLRNKYLLAVSKKDYTFKSVILCGVHDVKTLKLRVRDGEERKYNSPWNIAINFNVDLSFNADEIETMIVEYCNDKSVCMDTKVIANRIFYFTDGYPFLVSRICKIIDEDILKDEAKPWTVELIDRAVKLLLNDSNTLFDDLFKNIENNEELKSYVYEIVFNGAIKTFNNNNSLINLGTLYGILKNECNMVKVSNRIFEQIIYNYFTSCMENSTSDIEKYNFREKFLLPSGGLDMELVLLRFQQFMREQFSSKDVKFLENNGRTLFLAFLKPIINGIGFDFKEVQISEEKRLDIVVTYNSFKYIIELKIWRGNVYHEKGINQLVDYLDIHSLNKGYLIVFNFNENKEYTSNTELIKDKTIFTVSV